MKHIHCLNNISSHGTDLLDPEKYVLTDSFDEAEGILVRSAAMHDMEFPQACAQSHVPVRASTTFPSSAAPTRASSFSTPPARTPTPSRRSS